MSREEQHKARRRDEVRAHLQAFMQCYVGRLSENEVARFLLDLDERVSALEADVKIGKATP